MLEIYQFVFMDGVFHSIGIPIRAESTYKNPILSNVHTAAVNATLQQYRILDQDVTDPYQSGIYKIIQLQFAAATGRVQFTIAYTIDGYLQSEGAYNYLQWSTKWAKPIHQITVQQYFPFSMLVEPGMYSVNWTATSALYSKTDLDAMQRFAIVTKLTQHVGTCKEPLWNMVRTSYSCIGWQCHGYWNRYHLVWLLLTFGILLAILMCVMIIVCTAVNTASGDSHVTVVDSGPWWMFFLPAALMPVGWYAPYYGGGEYISETTEYIGGNETNFGDAGFGDAD